MKKFEYQDCTIIKEFEDDDCFDFKQQLYFFPLEFPQRLTMNIFFEKKIISHLVFANEIYCSYSLFANWVELFFQSMYTYVNQMPSTVSLFKSTRANAYLSQF